MRQPRESGEPRKTNLMQRVEREARGEKLETLLPRRINAIGLSATADELRISKATLGYWLLKLGITVQRVAVVAEETLWRVVLAPGETLWIRELSGDYREVRRRD